MFPGSQPDRPPKTEHALFSSASLHLMEKRSLQTKNFFRTHDDTTNEPHHEISSMTDIIRIAAAKFIDSSTEPTDPPSRNSNEDEVPDDVELIHYLLRAADEVDRKKYEQATIFLDLCDFGSSKTGNLAQRVTHYFVQALRERVRKETGVETHPISDLLDKFHRLNVEETITATSPLVAVMNEKIPFFQVGQLAGVQAIVESVEKAKMIHIIDLQIRNGMQWTALMQALSSSTAATKRRRRRTTLKITAVVTTVSENLVRGTGERLAKFAESMNIPFSFKSVVVSSLTEIDETQFDLDPKETVAVFSEYALKGLVSNPNQLEPLMAVFKKIHPSIMVVIELEANLKSSNFAHRFVEVLFHYGAFFDCLDSCLESWSNDCGGGGGDRGLMESMYLNDCVESCLESSSDDYGSSGGGNMGLIESMLLHDHLQKFLENEKEEMARAGGTVDAWRKLCGRFPMWEVGLSSSAMETVNMLLRRFVGGKYCTLDMDGESLVVGWKGTPFFSISTWKFLIFKNKHGKQNTARKLIAAREGKQI